MIKALDQTGDLNGQQLYRLTKLYPLPGFVKRASSEDIYGDGELQTHQFADQAHRMFPCHTGPSTYISTLFFMDKKAEMDPEEARYIEARLDDFAFYHGISESVTKMKEKLAADVAKDDVTTLPDDDFAIVLAAGESPSGAPERHYPLRNALEVKHAAEWLKKNNESFPYKYRQKIASKILAKAEQYGAGLADLDNYLQKQAGVGACAGYDAAQFLFSRARLLKAAGKLEYAVKVAEIAKTVASREGVLLDQDQRIKLASLIDEIDRETGLHRLIENLPKPEDTFFVITEKAASELRNKHLSTTTGNIYKLQDLNSLKLAEVRGMMGTDFADAISTGGLFVSPEKIAEIVPTLPRGDAELFDRLLTSVGINPVAKEAAHERGGFDSAELKALATLHRGVS